MATVSILVAEPLGEEGLSLLKNNAQFDVSVRSGLKKAELIDLIPSFDCLLVRSQTDVDRSVIEAGTKLKLIGRAGTGVDNIDINAAKKYGLAVINTPAGNSISTAEYTFALMLSLARKIPAGHRHLLQGLWARSSFKGFELAQKTFGIVGLGNIGRLLAPRAQAFGMNVQAFDPFVADEHFASLRVKKLSLDELLATSDIVTLHCGLTEQTKHLINHERIALMKKNAYIINAARGELIDPGALIKALDEGIIAGAAIDVFAVEPPAKDDPLIHHPKILATPHLAASTEEAQTRVSTLLAEQVIGFFSGSDKLTRVV